jgi:hypothetical protein
VEPRVLVFHLPRLHFLPLVIMKDLFLLELVVWQCMAPIGPL